MMSSLCGLSVHAGASLEVGDQIAIGVYGEVGDEPYTLTITEYAGAHGFG